MTSDLYTNFILKWYKETDFEKNYTGVCPDK
jgi:hypothetical protein